MPLLFRPAALLVALFFLVPAALLSSCAPLSSHPAGREIPPRAVNTERVLENVPFYPQKATECGPVSLAEVMNYYGAKTTPARIARRIWSRTARGTLDIDMSLYPARAGFRAGRYRGSIEDIEGNIDHGRPLVVFVDYGFWVYRHGHFMVVVGYDGNGVIVHTGRTPFMHVPWDEFLGPWKKTGYWTLLITPKGPMPPESMTFKSPRATDRSGLKQ
ncbi:MAG: C39 family peptidase [Nitrospiraceae bacterium]|nr:C39 family peptidase [Nitrospiraceae bacterium]